jgi:hypothetical protein
MKKTALIVPSIRKESFERFVREWKPTGLFDRVDLILIEDNPSRTFEMDLDGGDHMHLCWEDIDREEWSWIVPRRSDTVRSFGYWWAWKAGYSYCSTLDDDCYPEPGYERWDEMHISMLTRTKWFNTLNNVRPRGTPYFNLGKREVHINHGLWTGILDYDAPQQLVNPIPETYTHDNRFVPHGAYFSLCGMNWCCRREAIVLMYHMLMGSSLENDGTLKRYPFDRWGDITCGIVAKKICDHIGWSVSSGTPYIHHDRASGPFVNLRKEAPALEVNEWLWEKIDAIELRGNSAVECYKQIADGIMDWDGEYEQYWIKLSQAMRTWAHLFQ